MGGGIAWRPELRVGVVVDSGWSMTIGVAMVDLGGDSLERLTE